MEMVKLSSKFHVVIPPKIRKSLRLKAGQKFQIIRYENRIELIPFRQMKEMRGFLKGMDTTIEREPDRV